MECLQLVYLLLDIRLNIKLIIERKDIKLQHFILPVCRKIYQIFQIQQQKTSNEQSLTVTQEMVEATLGCTLLLDTQPIQQPIGYTTVTLGDMECSTDDVNSSFFFTALALRVLVLLILLFTAD